MLNFKEYCKHLNESKKAIHVDESKKEVHVNESKKTICENIENEIARKTSTTGMSPENFTKAKQIAKQIGEAFQAALDKHNCAVYSPNGEDGTLSIQIKDGNKDAGINPGNLGDMDDNGWGIDGFGDDPDIESAAELCRDLNAAVVNGMEELKKLGYSYMGIDYDIENGSHSNYEDLCIWAATEESRHKGFPECYDILYSWSQNWGDFEPEFTE